MDDVYILLVEDNQRDATLIKEALKESSLAHCTVDVATDGELAIQMLHASEVRPNLIFLDLNLPKKSGLEVLKEIKRDSSFRPIPVIVLTNSRSEDDVVLAYSSYCNAYVRKPLGFDALLKAIESIKQFWLDTATLPKQGPELPSAPAPGFEPG